MKKKGWDKEKKDIEINHYKNGMRNKKNFFFW